MDINNKRVFVFNPETKQHVTIQLREMVGAVSADAAAAHEMGRSELHPACCHQAVHAHAQKMLHVPCMQVMPTTQTNTLLAALERDIALVDYAEPSNPEIRILASTPEADGLPADGWRFNDAKVAPGGTLIAGR